MQFKALGEPTPLPKARFTCVARIDRHKGHFLLLEAIAALKAEGRRVQLICVGDGDMRAEFELRRRELNLDSEVDVTGWVSNERVRQEIRSSRALILPSFAEGIPVVVMEALACERPVITTMVGGMPELVEDGKNGWLIPAGSSDALASALRHCLDTPDATILDMGRSGRAKAMELHDAANEAAKMAALFKISSAGADVRSQEAQGSAAPEQQQTCDL
jgi:glycosyltransferase involved in cell wall biosynthesis